MFFKLSPSLYLEFHLIKSVIETRIFKYVIGKVPKVLEHIFKMILSIILNHLKNKLNYKKKYTRTS